MSPSCSNRLPLSVRRIGPLRYFRFSLSNLVVLVALIAITCAIVRWGLRLPNLMANASIQPIVIGSAPVVTLLSLGLILTLYDLVHRRVLRPFWVGFLAFGAIAVIAY